MLREDANREHRLNVLYVRDEIVTSAGYDPSTRLADITELDKAHEAHIKAKVQFSIRNTDNTMIDLIGTWSRLTKLIRDFDDKYGEHR